MQDYKKRNSVIRGLLMLLMLAGVFSLCPTAVRAEDDKVLSEIEVAAMVSSKIEADSEYSTMIGNEYDSRDVFLIVSAAELAAVADAVYCRKAVCGKMILTAKCSPLAGNGLWDYFDYSSD